MACSTDCRTKIMVIAHGHPDHAKGGGEIAAYNLHRQLNERSDFQSVFLARHNRQELLHPGTPVAGTGREKEILVYATMPDWFRFSQPDKALVWRDFRQTLSVCKPAIVHFHHYLHLGLEFLREVHNHDPSIRIVLTLHEYYGICHNQGQMVKTDRSLCHESSPSACSRCFSAYTAQDFMLRELFIKSHFELVDEFISPSEFLKQRYVSWGLPAHKISVIDNLLEHSADDTEAKPQPATVRCKTLSNGNTLATSSTSSTHPQGTGAEPMTRFAFFGQINWFKGLDLLLEAVAMLPPAITSIMHLDIHGSGLEHQGAALRDKISKSLDSLSGSVSFHGAYTREELPRLMQQAHWIVVPSRWWENSPMVIEEARFYGVPVICSDIGGMAEKVRHGENGLHFQARRAESLAHTLIQATGDNPPRNELSRAWQASHEPDAALNQHVMLYQRLMSAPPGHTEQQIEINDKAA